MVDVLVLGNAGQLGFELMRAGWPGGWQIAGLDRAELDITDERAVSAVIASSAPAVVVNAAAYTAVDRAEQEPDLAYAVNRDGVLHLARACRERDLPLVHVSTDYVFDGEKTDAYRESDVARPLGVYGLSKLEGERAVRETLPAHVILRTSWVFGAHGANFVKTMLRLAAERDVVRVVDDQRGRPTAAADIARAIVRIATRLRSGAGSFGTFHFGGDPATTWHGLAREVFAIRSARGERVPELVAIDTSQYPTPARRPKSSELDCTKIASVYGIEAPPWRDALRAVIEEVS